MQVLLDRLSGGRERERASEGESEGERARETLVYLGLESGEERASEPRSRRKTDFSKWKFKSEKRVRCIPERTDRGRRGW
jgi:hypothetical protein